MVLDTSAIVAILLREPEAARFNELIATAATRLISAATLVEVAFVIEARKRETGRADLDRFLADASIGVVALTEEHAAVAREAFRRYGKGRHAAALNLGDVFAYALAKATGEPLLFKGNDFAQTDIVPAA